MPCGATGGLNEAGLAAQKTFLVRVKNCHERNFRQIQTFAQKIYSNQHVKFAFAE